MPRPTPLEESAMSPRTKPALKTLGSKVLGLRTMSHNSFASHTTTQSSAQSIYFSTGLTEDLPRDRPVSKNAWVGASYGSPRWPGAKGVHTKRKELLFESAVQVRRRRSLVEAHISPSSEAVGWLRRVSTWPVLGVSTNSLDYLSADEGSTQVDFQATMTSSEWYSTKSKTFTMGQKSVSFDDDSRDRRKMLRERGAFWAAMQKQLNRFKFHRFSILRKGSNVSSIYSSVSSVATSLGTLLLSVGSLLQDIFSWNENIVSMFSLEGDQVGYVGFGVMFLVLLATNLFVFVSMTDSFGCAMELYLALIRCYDLWLPLVGAAAFGLLLLHVTDIYDWKYSVLGKGLLFLPIIIIAFCGLLFTTKTRPEMPLIVGNLCFPVLILLMRVVTIGKWASVFFHITINRCAIAISLINLVIWFTIVSTSSIPWGDQSDHRLRESMSSIFHEYGLEGWLQCQEEQSELIPNEDIVIACNRIQLIAFLAWTCPVIQAVVLLSLSLLVSLRIWHLKKSLGESGDDRTIQRMIFFAILVICWFWITCSVFASSVGLSNTLLPVLASALVVCGVWVITSTSFRELARQVKDCPLWLILQPFLISHWAKALIFCLLNIFVLLFFALEFLTRFVQRLRNKPGPNWWTTARGAWMMRVLSGWNWFAVLERSWILATFFVVGFVLGVRTLLVFLSWLNSQMLLLVLWQSLLIFYGAGLVLCLNPFAPFILIYMAAGAVIVSRVRDDIGFMWGTLCASFVSLVLKLVASAVQHKFIGKLLGKYDCVQSLVGVETILIRAVEVSLKESGMSATKVAILCGMPDWPTSVLAGILQVPIVPMLVDTLPVFFLIVPPVLAGACLLDADLQKVAPLIILLMSVVNGIVFIAAVVLTFRTAATRQMELSQPRISHVRLEGAVAPRREHTFYVSRHFCLALAVVIQLACCWVTSFLPGHCFRPFDLHSNVVDSFENGGLDNNYFNLFRPLGVIVCILLLASCLLFLAHLAAKNFRRDDIESETGVPSRVPPNKQVEQDHSGTVVAVEDHCLGKVEPGDELAMQVPQIPTQHSVASPTSSPRYLEDLPADSPTPRLEQSFQRMHWASK